MIYKQKVKSNEGAKPHEGLGRAFLAMEIPSTKDLGQEKAWSVCAESREKGGSEREKK